MPDEPLTPPCVTKQQWALYGGWGKVSDGRVSSDGSRIVTSDGQGVPILGSFGIRKKSLEPD